MLRPLHILKSVALLTFCTSSAIAAQTDADVIHPGEVIEEIVIQGVHRCGSWPIEHRGLTGCAYEVLTDENLATALDLRSKLFSSCLSCQGNQCVSNVWPDDMVVEKLLCRRVFWTPTRVVGFLFGTENSYSLRTFSVPLNVSFSFAISATGRVQDIEVISFEGEISEEKLLELIERGAAKTRYEPIVVEDVTYKIVGLKEAFVLDDH